MTSLSHAVVEIYRLHDAVEWQPLIPDILQKLESATEAHRVALFRTVATGTGEVMATEIMACAADHRKPAIYQLALRESGLGELLDTLNRGNPYHFDDHHIMRAAAQRFFPEHVKHILIIPMFASNRLWGFVRFDDTRPACAWNDMQQNIMRAAVGQMATAIERIERQMEQLSHAKHLSRLYGIMEQADLTTAERIHALLQIGLEELSLETGIVSQINDDEYLVKYLETNQPDLSEGQIFNRGLTYCDMTLAQGKTFAIHHAQASEYNRHPAYQKLKLESYIGSLIVLNGQVYGTVNFSRSNPHPIFTSTDHALVNEIARLVEQLLAE